jgi:hypothetical protein
MSFGAISPRIVIIEDNSNGEDAQVKNFMESVAYTRFKRAGSNDWYAKKNDETVTTSQVVRTGLFIFSSVIWRRFKSLV